MSNRCSLETQTKKVNLVIDYPFDMSLSDFEDNLRRFGYIYAFIVHDKDTDKNGQLKVKHIHLILNSPKRHRLAYYLTNIAELIGKYKLDNNGLKVYCNDGVEVMTSESFEWDLQYLIHKNDTDKYQYEVMDIKTNLSDVNLYEMMSLQVHKEISINDVIDIVCDSSTLTEIACKLGVGHFNLYRSVISCAIQEGYLNSKKKRDNVL